MAEINIETLTKTNPLLANRLQRLFAEGKIELSKHRNPKKRAKGIWEIHKKSFTILPTEQLLPMLNEGLKEKQRIEDELADIKIRRVQIETDIGRLNFEYRKKKEKKLLDEIAKLVEERKSINKRENELEIKLAEVDDKIKAIRGQLNIREEFKRIVNTGRAKGLTKEELGELITKWAKNRKNLKKAREMAKLMRPSYNEEEARKIIMTLSDFNPTEF